MILVFIVLFLSAYYYSLLIHTLSPYRFIISLIHTLLIRILKRLSSKNFHFSEQKKKRDIFAGSNDVIVFQLKVPLTQNPNMPKQLQIQNNRLEKKSYGLEHLKFNLKLVAIAFPQIYVLFFRYFYLSCTQQQKIILQLLLRIIEV